jgi:NAD(P)H-hydrate epimerase
VQATRTFTFQIPKLAFFFPENALFVGEWTIGDIGLHPGFILQTGTPFYFLERENANRLRKKRSRFAHKGSYGHSLLIAGSWGKMGAAVLAARACLRAGTGLLSVHAPRSASLILPSAVPEAMYSPDKKARFWSSLPETDRYTAIGVGPGIGMEPETRQALKNLLMAVQKPMVLDADALNMLAENPEWWRYVPENSILTPHPKEFERLFGPTDNSFHRNEVQREMAQKHRICLILKGAYTAVAFPDGTCWFNSSGNPGMATGGSGDVLTGILTGLLAQHYSPREACLLGVYVHGLSGDLAAEALSQEAMTAGDLIDFLGPAWGRLGDT